MRLKLMSLVAHAKLSWRRGSKKKQVVGVGGYTWAYCCHRDHRTGRRCWQWFVYDSYCAHHNSTCYSGCETEGET